MPVALMRRIERPAEQADSRPPPIAPRRQVCDTTRVGQGRTCPCPVTR
jgi:hypothetical protein